MCWPCTGESSMAHKHQAVIVVAALGVVSVFILARRAQAQTSAIPQPAADQPPAIPVAEVPNVLAGDQADEAAAIIRRSNQIAFSPKLAAREAQGNYQPMLYR